nr:MAG TPA: hypothetical protein [Caudoviricetes sp.]
MPGLFVKCLTSKFYLSCNSFSIACFTCSSCSGVKFFKF